jgi:hypothetical protein
VVDKLSGGKKKQQDWMSVTCDNMNTRTTVVRKSLYERTNQQLIVMEENEILTSTQGRRAEI